MQHEKDVLEKITELRGKAINPRLGNHQKESLNSDISNMLSGIIVQAEQYPDLKSNTNFVQLQETLYEIEENIAASRRFYNAAVTNYNNAIEMFPSSVMANMMKLERRETFNIPEVQRQNVNVGQLFES